MVKNRRLDGRDGCCSVSFLKYLVFIYHFVFYLAGLSILIVGLWTIFFKSDYVVLLATKIFSISAYLLVGAGVSCILVGVVGCVGLTKENKTCVLIVSKFLFFFVFF
uniref:Uncharacterized protein n=1 Tax=Romanomermis culicivorax TaxID=13658 RepID=A0A915KRS3_ROMCU